MCRAGKGLNCEESRLLRWAQQDFANETLRRLRDDHLHDVRYVFWLQHLSRVLPRVRGKIRGHCARANRAYPDAVRAQVLSHTLREAEQSPFRGAVNSATRECIFPASEAILMMWPLRRSIIPGATALLVRNTDFKLVSNTESQMDSSA